VTIPHKVAALAVADSASPTALAIGAANTLTFVNEGIVAENTDAGGFLDALAEPVAGKRALVLGAGGAARAVVHALIDSGAADVQIWNRTSERADELATTFHARAVKSPQPADIVVNTTSVGLHEGTLPLEGLEPAATAVEMAYGSGETPLTRWARASGARVVDGLEVLVRQGALSFARWTGVEPPLDVMRAAARSEISPHP
jgi:shikimate dehydrogenase